MNCFQCRSSIESINQRCTVCNWGEHRYIEENEPKYLVFLDLITSAQSKKDWLSGKLAPTSRQLAIFEHGDQFRIDGACWRITALDTKTSCLFVSGWKAGLTKKGILVTSEINKNLAEKIRIREEADAKRDQKSNEMRIKREEIEKLLAGPRATGKYSPEHIPFLTDDDWSRLSEDEIDKLRGQLSLFESNEDVT